MRRRKKVVFIIIDGLPDLTNGRTPLSEAYKPNLDYLASRGMCGEVLPIPKNLWDERMRASVSHFACISLLGYDLKNYVKFKRGPIEAIGADIPYRQGWLALRCNFATVDKEMRVLDRRVGRNFLGLDELACYINQHIKLDVPHIFLRTYGHRAVLVFKEKLSDAITDSDPLSAWEKVKKVEALTPKAEKSAELVQQFIDNARQLIEFHPVNEQRIKNGIPPANYILTREAGNKVPKFKSFPEAHKLKNAVCIAEKGAMRGVCLLAGFDAITIPEKKFASTLTFIFSSIENALVEYDFVLVHVKGPDEPAHDGDFYKKQMIIEAIDEKLEMFRDFNGIVVITSDHITSCKTKKHEWGPVPILIYGKKKDKVKSFDEYSVKKGGLKRITGRKLWKIVLGK